jgi:hypothetical protein
MINAMINAWLMYYDYEHRSALLFNKKKKKQDNGLLFDGKSRKGAEEDERESTEGSGEEDESLVVPGRLVRQVTPQRRRCSVCPVLQPEHEANEEGRQVELKTMMMRIEYNKKTFIT